MARIVANDGFIQNSSWGKSTSGTYEYLEIAVGDRGNVIAIGMPDIFAFFGRPAR